MKLQYEAIYDDVAGCAIVPLHDKIYEVMRKYDLQNVIISVKLEGLDYSEDENGNLVETIISIPEEEE